MVQYIPIGDSITPTWLTAVLCQAGVLNQGEVESVIRRDSGAFNSQTGYLSLCYSADAPPHAPTQWMPQQRHEDQREERILQQYHRQLLANRVQNYAWDDLVADYKTGLIF